MEVIKENYIKLMKNNTYVILKIFKDNNKFKYLICDNQNPNKILFNSSLEFSDINLAKKHAFQIIDEKFDNSVYNCFDGFGTNCLDD